MNPHAVPVTGQHGQLTHARITDSHLAHERYMEWRADQRDSEIDMGTKDILASWQRRSVLALQELDHGNESPLVRVIALDALDFDGELAEMIGLQFAALTLIHGNIIPAEALQKLTTAIQAACRKKAEWMATKLYEDRRE